MSGGRKITEAARGESCVRCGARDGTVVLAHYTGWRQAAFGKGRGCKGSDLIGAHLCMDCHEYFDRPAARKSIEVSEEFLFLVCLTVIRLQSRGVIRYG